MLHPIPVTKVKISFQKHLIGYFHKWLNRTSPVLQIEIGEIKPDEMKTG